MNSDKLILAREYYDKVQAGEDRKKAAKELGVTVNIEASPEYRNILMAVAELERDQLKYELELAKRRQLRAYNKLLDEGEELMDKAKTTSEKIQAQANQRANLQSGVVDSAMGWTPDSQAPMGDILDGVVV